MDLVSPPLPPERSRFRRFLIWNAILLIVFALPVAWSAAQYLSEDHPASFRAANWSSTGYLPSAESDPQARVMIFAARNGTWRSIFADHCWIVIKPRGGRYTRYEVTGFGIPLRTNGAPPDSFWFSNRPQIVADVHGVEAEAIIPKLVKAIENYTWRNAGDYRIWPGPNSNTFVATVMRAAPELQAALPPTAIGKDYRADGSWFGPTPSETGFELEIYGLLGIKAGWVEGIEFNLFTLVAGLDIRHPAIKLPGIGRIGIDPPHLAQARKS